MEKKVTITINKKNWIRLCKFKLKLERLEINYPFKKKKYKDEMLL